MMKEIKCNECGHPVGTRGRQWKHASYESSRESYRTKCDTCGCTNASPFREEEYVAREVLSASGMFLELHGALGEHIVLDFKGMKAMINGKKMRPIVELTVSFRMRAKFD